MKSKELEESLNCERVWRKILGKGLTEKTTEIEGFLNYERVWRKIWESDFNINDEIELREKILERIDETEELRRKREIYLENLFNIDNRAIDL